MGDIVMDVDEEVALPQNERDALVNKAVTIVVQEQPLKQILNMVVIVLLVVVFIALCIAFGGMEYALLLLIVYMTQAINTKPYYLSKLVK